MILNESKWNSSYHIGRFHWVSSTLLMNYFGFIHFCKFHLLNKIYLWTKLFMWVQMKGGRAGSRQGGKVARRQGGKVARWQGGKVARWQGGRVARWQGGKVARWQGGNGECHVSIATYQRCENWPTIDMILAPTIDRQVGIVGQKSVGQSSIRLWLHTGRSIVLFGHLSWNLYRSVKCLVGQKPCRSVSSVKNHRTYIAVT